jgi:acetyltransferase-like isoleucine patch superfamily enzyme
MPILTNVSKRLAKFNRDSAPHMLSCAIDLARGSADTALTRMLAWWWGIELGPECKFYGLPLLRRLPQSRIRIGPNCQFRSSAWSNLVGINRPCVVSTLRHAAWLEIGRECGFSGTVIGCASRISIGDRVMCGANTTITDTDWHAMNWRDRYTNVPGKYGPVTIGDDVWLGMNVVVLKGVEIGRRTVVGAGSIVSRSLPEGVIAAGQPAVVIRKLTENEQTEAVPNSNVR